MGSPTLINTHNSHLRVLYSEDLAPVDHAVPRTVHRCWADRTSLDPGHLWGAMIAEGQADCSGERRGRRGSPSAIPQDIDSGTWSGLHRGSSESATTAPTEPRNPAVYSLPLSPSYTLCPWTANHGA